MQKAIEKYKQDIEEDKKVEEAMKIEIDQDRREQQQKDWEKQNAVVDDKSSLKALAKVKEQRDSTQQKIKEEQAKQIEVQDRMAEEDREKEEANEIDQEKEESIELEKEDKKEE